MSDVTVVVPTTARSPLLPAAIEALRHQSLPCRIVLVDQSGGAAPDRLASASRWVDRVERPGRNLGFAGGVDLGLDGVATEYVGLLNDDALVAPDWLASLQARLESAPDIAACQGINLRLDLAADVGEPAGVLVTGLGGDLGRTLDPSDPDRPVDGAGLGFNRWWQAVQLFHARPVCAVPARAFEVFGASATAVLFRRTALERVRLPRAGVLDRRLFAYYEDVDLACRLRAAGLAAWVEPAARAWHAGSLSGAAFPVRRRVLLGANRWLVVARLLGRRFPAALPRLLLRDLADLASSTRSGDLALAAAGVLGAWARALRWLPSFVRGGPPAVPGSLLAAFSAERLEAAPA